MMEIYRYTDDWDDIHKAWTLAMGSYYQKEVFPPDGYIVIRDSKPLMMAWVYVAFGIGIYWMAWITPNPDNSAIQNAVAMKFLLKRVDEIMQRDKYNCCFIMSNNEPLSKMLKTEGFVKNHEGVQYWKTWETKQVAV